MGNWTPGPWETSFVDYEGHPYYVNTVPHYQGGPKLHGSAGAIAKLPASKFHDQAANARLIAAAPTILDALCWAYDVESLKRENHEPGWSDDLHRAAGDAIAKATA